MLALTLCLGRGTSSMTIYNRRHYWIQSGSDLLFGHGATKEKAWGQCTILELWWKVIKHPCFDSWFAQWAALLRHSGCNKQHSCYISVFSRVSHSHCKLRQVVTSFTRVSYRLVLPLESRVSELFRTAVIPGFSRISRAFHIENLERGDWHFCNMNLY